MWKNARRLLKILLVWTAIVILTLDVGLAGRIAGRRCRRAAVCSTDECSCNAKSAGGKGSGGGKSLVDPPPTVSMPGHHDDSRPDDGVSSPSDQVAPSPPPVAPPSDLPPTTGTVRERLVDGMVLAVHARVRRNVGAGIAAERVGDAAVPAREEAHLRLPAPPVAAVFVDEQDRRAAARLFVIKIYAIERLRVGHRCVPRLSLVDGGGG